MYAIGYMLPFIVIFGGGACLLYNIFKDTDNANSNGTNYNSKTKKDQINKQGDDLCRMIKEEHARGDRERAAKQAHENND